LSVVVGTTTGGIGAAARSSRSTMAGVCNATAGEDGNGGDVAEGGKGGGSASGS
jgi:hypothetical protein